MTGFLFDENLPRVSTLQARLPITHTSVLGLRSTDSQIWIHAQRNDLAIVTKDADFSQRVVLCVPPPRVNPFARGKHAAPGFRRVAEADVATHRILDFNPQARERLSGTHRNDYVIQADARFRFATNGQSMKLGAATSVR